jgi:hypothetical protein
LYPKLKNMAKIYDPPQEITVPEIFGDSFEIDAYNAACKKFKDDLKEWCIKRNPQEHVGEVIGFPVADGQAEYMVASLKPVQLIHIPLWDAWNFQYAHLLGKKEIIAKIAQKKAMEEFFLNRKK